MGSSSERDKVLRTHPTTRAGTRANTPFLLCHSFVRNSLITFDKFCPSTRPCTPELQAVEIQVDDRRGVQRQQLAEQQTADNRDAQLPAQLRARARAEHQ